MTEYVYQVSRDKNKWVTLITHAKGDLIKRTSIPLDDAGAIKEGELLKRAWSNQYKYFRMIINF